MKKNSKQTYSITTHRDNHNKLKEIIKETNYLQLNEKVVKEFGAASGILLALLFSIENGAFIGQSSRLINYKGYFLCEAKYIEKRVGISTSTQSKHLGNLIAAGFISKKHGELNKRLFKLNHKRIAGFFMSKRLDDIGISQKKPNENQYDKLEYWINKIDGIVEFN